MIMYLILGALICFIIAWLLYLSIQKDKNKLKDKGILVSDNETTYISGFDIVEGGQNVSLNLTNDKLILIFNLTKQSVDIGSPFKKILTNDIIDAQIMTKEQIEKNISIGKIFLFGFLAWNTKNNESTFQNYIVIKYRDGENIKDLILQSNKNQELVYNIKKLKNKEVK